MSLTIFKVMWILCIAIILHELGHYITYWLIMRERPIVWWGDMSINIGNHKDYIFMKKWERASIYIAGIKMGMYPIGLMLFMYPEQMFYTYIIYFMGCSSDIKNLWGLRK